MARILNGLAILALATAFCSFVPADDAPASATPLPPPPPSWPDTVSLQPAQRVTLRCPPFQKARLEPGGLIALEADAPNSLLHLQAPEDMAGRLPAALTLVVTAADGKEVKVPVAVSGEVLAELRSLLHGVGQLEVATIGVRVVVRGFLRRPDDRVRLQRVLSLYPGVVDLTREDKAGPHEMVEIDVVIVVCRERIEDSVGFNFFQLMQFHLDIFESTARSAMSRTIPFQSPAGALIQPALATAVAPFRRGTHPFTWGQTLTAAVDYNVNIANAFGEESKVIARPHLVTRNGEKASFQDGGEVAFRVSGLNSGDIKLYRFGVLMEVTPTILEDGLVLMDVTASRSTAPFPRRGTTSDDVQFDKTEVASSAAVSMGETLILSGLYLRERRTGKEGIPVIRDIPGLNLLFSNHVTSDEVLSTVIFLTPRRPSHVDEDNLGSMNGHRQRRLDFRRAIADGSSEALDALKQKYPMWYKPRPNRYISHTFLTDNSSIYRELLGEDLRTEPLEKGTVRRAGQK